MVFQQIDFSLKIRFLFSFSEKETKILCEYWLKLHQICKELTALKIPSTYMMLESYDIEQGYGYSPLEYFKRAYFKLNKRLTYHEEYR